jgi:hypothetical protein
MWGTLSEENGFVEYNCSRLPQTGWPTSRIYIPQEQGGSGIPPRTGFPFGRLLRLCRATMEVFEPASTRAKLLKNEFIINNIQKFRSHLTGNTLRLRYKDKTVKAAYGHNPTVHSENHTKHINTLCG